MVVLVVVLLVCVVLMIERRVLVDDGAVGMGGVCTSRSACEPNASRRGVPAREKIR